MRSAFTRAMKVSYSSIGPAGDPARGQALGVILDHLIGHQVANRFHHHFAVLVESQLYQIRVALNFLIRNTAPLEQFIACDFKSIYAL